MEKETLTRNQRFRLYKAKLEKPIFIISVGWGSFVMALTFSFYLHKFFNSYRAIEWLFSDLASLFCAMVFTLKTLPWIKEKKGKTTMALFLTMAVFFYWRYDLTTMLGLVH